MKRHCLQDNYTIFAIFRSFYGGGGRHARNRFIQIPLPNANISEDDMDSDSDNERYSVIEEDTDSDEEEIVESSESEYVESSEPDSENNEESEDNENEPSSDNSDDNVRLADLAATQARQVRFEWPKQTKQWTRPINPTNIDEVSLRIHPDLAGKVNRFSSSRDFYDLFVTDELWNNIEHQTDLYNNYRSISSGSRKVKKASLGEIQTVIGTMILMGIVKLPNRKMYWGANTRNDLIADNISRNRFDEIVSMLHFNDNSLIDERNYNAIYKVQPLVDALRKQFKENILPETYLSVDEQMIPFKGKSRLRRYLPKKPKKWGYKLWARAGISGYIYDFEVDGSPISKGPPENRIVPEKCGESDFVVMRLCEGLEKNKHFVFYDNYFSSPDLAVYLNKQKGIFAVSTLDRKRSRNCPIPAKKELMKEPRGTMIELVDEKSQIVITVWVDSKPVLMLSNYLGKEPTDQCSRYDRSQKKKIDVARPAAVAIYNKFMGGVDKCDMLLSLYRTKLRTRKWYLRIAFHLFSLASINSWILYQALGGKDPLVKYLIALATNLITGKPAHLDSSEDDSDIEHDDRKPESRKACQVITHQRYSKFNHWPKQIECKNAQRCKKEGCKRKTRFWCTQCKVYLCVSGSDCFRDFHIAQ